MRLVNTLLHGPWLQLARWTQAGAPGAPVQSKSETLTMSCVCRQAGCARSPQRCPRARAATTLASRRRCGTRLQMPASCPARTCYFWHERLSTLCVLALSISCQQAVWTGSMLSMLQDQSSSELAVSPVKHQQALCTATSAAWCDLCCTLNMPLLHWSALLGESRTIL